MSDISPIARTFATGYEPAARAATANGQDAGVARGSDRVELSGSARLLAKIAENPIRQELVDRVKAEIDAGTYETEDKLDAALEELLSDL